MMSIIGNGGKEGWPKIVMNTKMAHGGTLQGRGIGYNLLISPRR